MKITKSTFTEKNSGEGGHGGNKPNCSVVEGSPTIPPPDMGKPWLYYLEMK